MYEPYDAVYEPDDRCTKQQEAATLDPNTFIRRVVERAQTNRLDLDGLIEQSQPVQLSTPNPPKTYWSQSSRQFFNVQDVFRLQLRSPNWMKCMFHPIQKSTLDGICVTTHSEVQIGWGACYTPFRSPNWNHTRRVVEHAQTNRLDLDGLIEQSQPVTFLFSLEHSTTVTSF